MVSDGSDPGHLALGVHFWSAISGVDGKELSGIDVNDPQWTSVGLVRLDSVSGGVLAKRDLASDGSDERQLR